MELVDDEVMKVVRYHPVKSVKSIRLKEKDKLAIKIRISVATQQTFAMKNTDWEKMKI